MKKTYTVVHVDTGQGVEAWFPDFPGVTLPGDRLADTIFSAPLALRRHVEQLLRDGSPVPEPTTLGLLSLAALPLLRRRGR